MTPPIVITAALAELPEQAGAAPAGPRRLPPSDGGVRDRSRHTAVSRRLAEAIARAARQAGMSLDEMAGPRTGLVSGSCYGCASVLDEIRRQLAEKGPRGVDPVGFARATHSYPLSANAITHRFQGPTAALVSSAAAGLEALICAADWLRAGRCARVLVAAYEDFDGPVAAHAAMACDDAEALTESLALLLIERADAAEARGATPLAALKGFGAFGNSGDVHALVAAMRRASGNAAPDELGVALAAAAAPALRDAEQAAVAIFPGPQARYVALKPRLGDCLGASGLVELALLLTDPAIPSAPVWLVNALDPRAGGVCAGVAPFSKGARA